MFIHAYFNNESTLKTNRQGKVCWWFNLKGNESDLCELESEWNSVALQIKWKLEQCYKLNTNNLAPDENLQTNNTTDQTPPINEESTATENNHATPATTTLTLVDPNQLTDPPIHTDNHAVTGDGIISHA